MSDGAQRFLDLCLTGQATPADVDRFVARWHESDGNEDLAAFLGMTAEEYNLWLVDEAALERIAEARRQRARNLSHVE